MSNILEMKDKKFNCRNVIKLSEETCISASWNVFIKSNKIVLPKMDILKTDAYQLEQVYEVVLEELSKKKAIVRKKYV